MAENVTYLLVYFLEALIMWQYASRLFYSKRKKWVEGLIISGGYIVLFILSRLDIYFINGIAFWIVNTLMLYYLFDINLKSACFHITLITAIMGFSELVILSWLSAVLGYLNSFKYTAFNLFFQAALSKMFYFLLVQFLIKLLHGKKISIKNDKKVSWMLLVITILSIGVMGLFYAICLNVQLPYFLRWMSVVGVLFMEILNFIIYWFYGFIQEKDQRYLEMQLQLQNEKNQLEYYKLLLKQDEEQKIVIHDIKNHLNHVGLLNEEGDSERTREYIAGLLNMYNMNTKIKFSDNDMLNIVLNRYQRICSENNIRFEIDVRNENLDYMSDVDVTALLGNILDNAIEAANKVRDGFMELSITRSSKNQTLITLQNSSETAPKIKGDKIFVTTKEDKEKHGIGMKSVSRVIEKYSGTFKAYYDEAEKVFHLVILLIRKKAGYNKFY